jgi:hypothetical protein
MILQEFRAVTGQSARSALFYARCPPQIDPIAAKSGFT